MSINLIEEKKYLKKLQEKLLNEINSLTVGTHNYSEEFYGSMKYLWENRSDMDSMEIFSNEQLINQVVRGGTFTIERLNQVKKMLDSPYFARIDFVYDGEEDVFPVYIGRFSFIDDESYSWVYDWRAPISSLYYDYEIGPATYEAPVGTISGKIKKKSQYKIKNGELEYANESSVSIYDDILQKELSSTSDKKMKNIVATIQKEQNQIIRNEKADILVIQGVAGSGKTSIALHRIAFFLYRYKEQMSAQDIIIISPNKVFADYISNVLPELGEQPIIEIGFEDIAIDMICKEYKFLTYTRQTESLIEGNDLKYQERVSFKSSLEFLNLLDEYMAYADEHYFKPKDYQYGKYIIEKEYIYQRFIQMRRVSVEERINILAIDILDKIKSINIIEGKAPSKSQIIKSLAKMYQFTDAMELYKNFYAYIGQCQMFKLEEDKVLEYADVYPYLYIKMYLEGWDQDRNIKHVIIDEMQDYTPVQYAVINKLYPCKKTILGDFGQNVNMFKSLKQEDLKVIYPNMEFVQIYKSYRSTFEIINFAQGIQKDIRIESTPRHGEEVKVIPCFDEREETEQILELIKEYQASDYVTLGIICKTSGVAEKWYNLLSGYVKVQLLTTDSVKFENGITISTVAMAKGLEFDEVIIPNANDKNYATEYDRNLLYIACTRAMHKLTLTCCGQLANICTNL